MFVDALGSRQEIPISRALNLFELGDFILADPRREILDDIKSCDDSASISRVNFKVKFVSVPHHDDDARLMCVRVCLCC